MSSFNAIEKPIIQGLENPTGKQIPIIFYERAVYNEEQSKKLNRPVYENKVYVKKHFDNLTCYDNRADDSDFNAHPKQYEYFLRNKKERAQGVPVGMLPGISPADIKVCEDMGLVTVEKLSEATGGIADIVGELKQRAFNYLNQASEIEALRKENAELKRQLNEVKNEPSNHSAKRSGRNATVRASDNGSQQQQ